MSDKNTHSILLVLHLSLQNGNKWIICMRILKSLNDLALECLMDQWLM